MRGIHSHHSIKKILENVLDREAIVDEDDLGPARGGVDAGSGVSATVDGSYAAHFEHTVTCVH